MWYNCTIVRTGFLWIDWNIVGRRSPPGKGAWRDEDSFKNSLKRDRSRFSRFINRCLNAYHARAGHDRGKEQGKYIKRQRDAIKEMTRESHFPRGDSRNGSIVAECRDKPMRLGFLPRCLINYGFDSLTENWKKIQGMYHFLKGTSNSYYSRNNVHWLYFLHCASKYKSECLARGQWRRFNVTFALSDVGL